MNASILRVDIWIFMVGDVLSDHELFAEFHFTALNISTAVVVLVHIMDLGFV